jgi:tetratricopeptide (TPR) repeat protein
MGSPYKFNVPKDQKNESVKLWKEQIKIPTYEVDQADKNPMFFENRVYQGSSGKVYPLPFFDSISTDKTEKEYTGIFLENDYIRILILPEIGGRIQVAQDKSNNNYNLFYCNDVIKPALVGLAGPWISGGVEFNWPQHHRPATYMPVQFTFQELSDGSKIVWMSDHDPMESMKGTLGLCLSPESNVLEAKVRLFNRTEEIKTFLWWANVAVEVHDEYQSIFPPDVQYVADHAARAMSEFPIARDKYYGIDYSPGTDISWYKNIPVPTSYMVLESEAEFIGGYDSKAAGGFIHVANKHISPGKKQWTWGNSDFGQTWNRNLTDENGPYIELMSGVYTNNQPDFSYLDPGETKTFSQYWYPIQGIGKVVCASRTAALSCVLEDSKLIIGLNVTCPLEECYLTLTHNGELISHKSLKLKPGEAFFHTETLEPSLLDTNLAIALLSNTNTELLKYNVIQKDGNQTIPDAAKEIPMPEEISSIEELYLAGEHLLQYRHPTRDPVPYWQEALARDSGDYRSNTALGFHAYKQGRYTDAQNFFKRAIERIITHHPNASDGRAYYGLGLALRRLGNLKDAYKAFYKSSWNYAWNSAALFEVACMDSINGNYALSLDHFQRSLVSNAENLNASALMAAMLDKLTRKTEARELLEENCRIDPLHFNSLFELYFIDRNQDALHEVLSRTGTEMRLFMDISFDYIKVGFYDKAYNVLQLYIDELCHDICPPILYLQSYISYLQGVPFKTLLTEAASVFQDYYFPSSLDEHDLLQWVVEFNPQDCNAPYYLGNLLYDKKRHSEAIELWNTAVNRGAQYSYVYRNLGIAFFNYEKNSQKALSAFESAIELNPGDSRLIYEYDQLRKRLNISIEQRYEYLLEKEELINTRDSLAIEWAQILILSSKNEEALNFLMSRPFFPWEGGEGFCLKTYARALIMLCKQALMRNEYQAALIFIDKALSPPESLGETWHPLQNKADLFYFKGMAYRGMAEHEKAQDCFQMSAENLTDFSGMEVKSMSELAYYSALSLRQLEKIRQADEVLNQMCMVGRQMQTEKAVIDYFATSLPLLLVFNDDIQKRQRIHGKYIEALGHLGLRKTNEYAMLKREILKEEVTHEIQFISYEM